MSDNLDMTPQLTLTPEADTAAAAAPAAPEAPTLTLEPAAADPADEAAAQKERDAHAVKLDESQLTEAERKMVDEFSQKIDITDSSVVLQYGAAAQKNVSEFSENTLQQIRTKDLGLAVGDFSLMRENRLRLDYLPADCQLLGGDLVVTSGLGGYYPSGLSVGTVEEVQLSDSGAASYAVLEPAADFDSLVEVFVIKSFDIQT